MFYPNISATRDCAHLNPLAWAAVALSAVCTNTDALRQSTAGGSAHVCSNTRIWPRTVSTRPPFPRPLRAWQRGTPSDRFTQSRVITTRSDKQVHSAGVCLRSTPPPPLCAPSVRPAWCHAASPDCQQRLRRRISALSATFQGYMFER